MPWIHSLALEPALPPDCQSTSDFLVRFSSAFHTCVPTPLAFASNTLGTLSIIAWLFAQLPQIYKNWSISSTSGLSFFFLVIWCLGDLGNLLGALFTHQATWQVAIGGYYVFVDLCLVGQWIWYEKLRHGSIIRRVWPRPGDNRYGGNDGGGDMEQVIIEGMPVSPVTASSAQGSVGHAKSSSQTKPKVIFRAPTFEQKVREEDEKPSTSLSATPNGTTIHRVGPSSPIPSPSPRTVLLIACLIAITHASPLNRSISHHSASSIAAAAKPTPLENAGTILSWISTVLYLGSRLPQLIKNWRRKSTAGLSPHLFLAAFCGNLFYSSAILTNPCAWESFGPYGGGGWAGAAGSDRKTWVLAALPFFLGAFGVLGLDASVGVQFLVYGDGEKVIVIEEDDHGRKQWHWRKVSGWMRGWIPSISEPKSRNVDAAMEREALIERHEREGDDYGTL